MPDALARLKVLINSSTPIVAMETVEEVRAITLVRSACAELNMAVFELTAGREAHRWGQSRSTPRAGKIAATLSLALWIGVIFMGRLTGFTTTRATEAAPPPTSVNFDDFLQSAPPDKAGTPATPAR